MSTSRRLGPGPLTEPLASVGGRVGFGVPVAGATSPPSTTTSASSSSDPAFSVVTDATFRTGLVSAVSSVVGLEMWKLKLAPGSRVVGPQVTVLSASEQSPPASSSRVQTSPGSLGNGSLTTTPVAVAAPLFVTVTVNPIVSPASTDGSSAVLLMSIALLLIVMVSESSSDPAFSEVTEAVFGTVSADATDVSLTMWIE